MAGTYWGDLLFGDDGFFPTALLQFKYDEDESTE